MSTRVIAFLRCAGEPDWAILREIAAAFAPVARVMRVAPPPEGLLYRPPSDPNPEQSWHAYEAVLLLDGVGGMLDWTQLRAISATIHAYAVEARTIFERAPIGDDAQAITLLGRLMFHADLPDSAARRSWSLHAPLAERVHVGASRYVQNWVTAPLSDDCPPCRGLPEMRFPDERALVDRFFDSDRGRDEILQDTAHFVASGPRFYLRGGGLRGRKPFRHPGLVPGSTGRKFGSSGSCLPVDPGTSPG